MNDDTARRLSAAELAESERNYRFWPDVQLLLVDIRALQADLETARLERDTADAARTLTADALTVAEAEMMRMRAIVTAARRWRRCIGSLNDFTAAGDALSAAVDALTKGSMAVDRAAGDQSGNGGDADDSRLPA